MRRTLLLAGCAAAMAGCGADTSGPPGLSCEVPSVAEAEGVLTLDVLLVIDSSSAMVGHEAALDDFLRGLPAALGFGGQPPSLQVAVVSGDPTVGGGGFERVARIPDCALPDGAFLSDLTTSWWTCSDDRGARCDHPNYTGTIDEAVACLAAVAPDGPDGPALLAAAATVTGPDNPDLAAFLRGGALAIVVIAGTDDASSDDASAWIDVLRRRTPLDRTALVAVRPPAAGRIDAAVAAFAPRSAAVSIAEADWTPALEPISELLKRDLGVPCLDPDEVDLDLDQAGLQTECYWTSGGEALSACPMLSPGRPEPSAELPCSWIDESSVPGCAVPTVEWPDWPGEPAELRCASRC